MRRCIQVLLVFLLVSTSSVAALSAQQPRPRPPAGGGNGGAGTMAEPCGEECGGGGDTSPPEIMLTMPGGGITYSAQPTIQLLMCDNVNLDLYTRQIKVNGVTQTSAFSGSYPGGCMASMAYYTATTLTLNLGTNTVWAYVCDFSSNCTQQTFSIERRQGPPPIVSLAPHNPDVVDYGRCVMSCFAATYAQSTVPFHTMDTPRNVTLAYNSATVDPKPFVHADVTHGVPDSAGTLPQYFVFKVRYGSADLTFLNGETALRFAPQLNTTMRMGGQFDASQLGGTGVYAITVIVGAQYSSSYYETTVGTRLIVVDNTSSFVARGWSIAEIQRAHIQGDGSVLIVSGNGSAVYFQKSGSTFVSPVGEFSRLTLAGGVYERTHYADSSRVRFSSGGLMGSAWDRFGNVTYVFHDGSNRVSQIREPSPALIDQNLAYGTYGLSSISALSRTTAVTVGSNRQLTAITDPDNISTAFGYFGSADSLLQTITDRAGTSITFGYHASYRQLDSVTSPAVPIYAQGTIQLVTRQVSWQRYGVPTGSTGTPAAAPRADTVQATLIDAGGYAVRMRVDRFGRATRTTAPLGDTVTVTTSSLGLPTQVVARLGITSAFSYDGTGFATSTTAGGVTINARKSGFGLVADSVWGQGPAQRLFISTSNGRVDSTRVGGYSGQPASAQHLTRYTYNARGQLLTVRDNDTSGTIPGDLVTWRAYDPYTLNLVKDSVPTGSTTFYHYDSYGRPDQVTVNGLPTRSTVYDMLNRPIRQYDGVNANPTEFFYGPIVLDSIRDPRGQRYQFMYNALGWQTHQKDPTGAEDSTLYNRRGMVRRYYNRRGQYVEMDHDSLRRVISLTGDVTNVSVSYDNLARVITETNGNGSVATYLNAVHRQPDSVRTVIQIPGGSAQTYSQRNTYSAEGWLQSVGFYRGGTSFLQSRLYRWRPNVGVLDSLKFGYSPWTRFGFNASLNATVTRFSAADSIRRTLSEGHGPSQIYSAGVRETYGYNPRGQMTLAGPVPFLGTQRREFAYDSLGHLRSAKYITGTGCTNYYQYGWACTGGTLDSTHALTYDEVGNRTDHYGYYGTGNRITDFNVCSYRTDIEGADSTRVCGAENVAFTWHAEGTLSGYSVNGTTYGFAYDPLGRLIRRSVNGTIQSVFLWSGDNLVAELNSTGTARVAEYAYYPGGLDHLHAMANDSGIFFAHTDAMGNVRALTDSAGTVRRTFNYGVWGQLYSNSTGAQLFSGTDRARFKGALWMGPELDLYYMRNRWYEPRTGRFLSEDPSGLEGGINQYVFAGNNPITGSDPTGLTMDLSNSGSAFPGCWSALCQQAWYPGGDWNADGFDDYAEFTEYSWGRQRWHESGGDYAVWSKIWWGIMHADSDDQQLLLTEAFFGNIRPIVGTDLKMGLEHGFNLPPWVPAFTNTSASSPWGYKDFLRPLTIYINVDSDAYWEYWFAPNTMAHEASHLRRARSGRLGSSDRNGCGTEETWAAWDAYYSTGIWHRNKCGE